jgi:anti-sigma factor ChrR (cupin superfamily)
VTSSAAKACDRADLVALFALGALDSDEMRSMNDHLEACSVCRQELDALVPVTEAFAAWPTDGLALSPRIRDRLMARIAEDAGSQAATSQDRSWSEPEWKQVAPGIWCKVLAATSARVTLLVRLEPRAPYPPHIHAGVEELHLLDGQLWIDDRKLCPGDYHRGEAGSGDQHVWSETGCMCLLITSPEDILR